MSTTIGSKTVHVFVSSRFRKTFTRIIVLVQPVSSSQPFTRSRIHRRFNATNRRPVVEWVGMDALGTPAHVILLKATDSLRGWRLRVFPAFITTPSVLTRMAVYSREPPLANQCGRSIPHRRSAQHNTNGGLRRQSPCFPCFHRYDKS